MPLVHAIGACSGWLPAHFKGHSVVTASLQQEHLLHALHNTCNTNTNIPSPSLSPPQAAERLRASSCPTPSTPSPCPMPSALCPGRILPPGTAKDGCWSVYRQGVLLGSGAFGTTYQATRRGDKSGAQYAIKVCAFSKRLFLGGGGKQVLLGCEGCPTTVTQGRG